MTRKPVMKRIEPTSGVAFAPQTLGFFTPGLRVAQDTASWVNDVRVGSLLILDFLYTSMRHMIYD